MAKQPKKEYVTKTTPRGEFIWPKVVVAEEFKGKTTYNTGFALQADDPWAVKCIALIDKMADDALAEAIKDDTRDAKKKAKSPWDLANKPYDNEVDKESGEETGRVIFKFKKNHSYVDKKTKETKFTKVPLFDGTGKKLVLSENFWSGSEGCVTFTFLPYAQGADVGAGVKLGLDAVQVIKLNKAGGKDADGYGFGKHEDADEIADDSDAEETQGNDSKSSDVAATDDDEDF